MSEPLTISTLVIALATAVAVFIKGIRKCNCTRAGVTVEREATTELERQQQFTINLVKILKATPSERKSTRGEPSEISDADSAAEIKENMKDMLKLLENTSSPATNVERRLRYRLESAATKGSRKILGKIGKRREKKRKKKEEQMQSKLDNYIEKEVQKRMKISVGERRGEDSLAEGAANYAKNIALDVIEEVAEEIIRDTPIGVGMMVAETGLEVAEEISVEVNKFTPFIAPRRPED